MRTWGWPTPAADLLRLKWGTGVHPPNGDANPLGSAGGGGRGGGGAPPRRLDVELKDRVRQLCSAAQLFCPFPGLPPFAARELEPEEALMACALRRTEYSPHSRQLRRVGPS